MTSDEKRALSERLALALFHWKPEEHVDPDGHVWRGKPPDLTTWKGMRLLIEAMQKRETLTYPGLKWHWRLDTPFEPGDKYYAGLTAESMSGGNGQSDYWAAGDTLPEAVALAADAALKETK